MMTPPVKDLADQKADHWQYDQVTTLRQSYAVRKKRGAIAPFFY
jgi:hypothetical protein